MSTLPVPGASGVLARPGVGQDAPELWTGELVGIALWVAVQLAIGLWVARRVASEEDYLLAGRRLGPWMASASIFATWFGAETCVGAASLAYEDGLGWHSVEPFAYGVVLVLTGLIFAAPLWRRGITTLADLYRTRFGPHTERLAALVLVPTSVFWAAAQVRAFGQVLSSASPGLDPTTGIAVAAVLAGGYTMLGGLLADVATDLLQGAVLVLGLVVLLVVVVVDAGGAQAAGEGMAAVIEARPGPTLGWLDRVEMWAIPLCGSVVAQEVLSRTLAARSPGVARASGLLGGGAYLLLGALPVALGLLGAHLLPALEDPEQVLPILAREHLPGIVYVLFAGSLVAAILSTVDSALLVASSLVERNLVLTGEHADRTRLWTARAGVLLLAAVAWWLARGSDGVFELIESASGFGSAGILVCTVFGLFTRIGGAPSALASLLAGSGVWILGDRPLHLDHPFLCSLAAALGTYLLLAGVEGFRGARRASHGVVDDSRAAVEHGRPTR